MMRYAAVAAVLVVFLIFFGPSLMAYGRNMARQLKSSWREQEQNDDSELSEIDFVPPPPEVDQQDERARVAEGADSGEGVDK